MNKSLYGEYDNYNYRSADEMSLEEQIESAKKALAAAIRLYQTDKSDDWDRKILEIKQRLRQLEAMNN